MGLIAREIEGRGIPTLSLTSALSITRAVDPPRAAFIDFPLGHTSGKPDAPEAQKDLLRRALLSFHRLETPGSVCMMPDRWSEDDAWKDAVMRPGRARDGSEAAGSGDNRVERFDTPQYQCAEDRELAEEALAEDGCPTCVFLEASA